jgi:phage FluMu protein gp41
MKWGAEIALWSARIVARGAMDHISESDNQGTIQLVRRAIKDAGGRIRHRDILRRINHRVSHKDLKSVLESLAEADEIEVQKIAPNGGGRPSIWYVLI